MWDQRYFCLFFDFCCLLHILLCLFFLIGSHQFFGFVLKDLNFVVELLFLLFKTLDLEIEVVEGGLDLDLLLCDFVSF